MKKKPSLIAPGTFVIAYFKDHMMSDGPIEPWPIKVPGWVIEDKPDHIKLSTWVANELPTDENSTTFTIVKHPGVVVKQLKETKKQWKY